MTTNAARPRRAIYRDADGNRWKDFGDGRLLLLAEEGEHARFGGPVDRAAIERPYGPLVEEPASPEAGAR